jgi:hypothetical protein
MGKAGKAQEARAMLEASSGLLSDNQMQWKKQENDAEEEDPYAALFDQKKVYDAQAKITAERIDTMLNEQAAAV